MLSDNIQVEQSKTLQMKNNDLEHNTYGLQVAQERNVAATTREWQKLPAADEVPWLVSQVMVEEEVLQKTNKDKCPHSSVKR